jgi:hypothetical protein
MSARHQLGCVVKLYMRDFCGETFSEMAHTGTKNGI